MTANVEPDEEQALLEVSHEEPRAPVVEDRDFRQPKRLSANVLGALRREFGKLLPELEVLFTAALGTPAGLTLEDSSERNVHDLYGELEAPLVGLSFRFRELRAWLFWDSLAAVRCVERILGSSEAPAEARELSRSETLVLQGLLRSIAERVSEQFGSSAELPLLGQKKETLGTWIDDGERADAHRVVFELELTLGEETSPVRIFLPGFDDGEVLEKEGEAPALPKHLEHVELELRARFPGGELALSQLLAMEEGDVVPLDAHVGDPLEVTVEDRPYASGSLGAHRGQVAVRIETIEPNPPRLDE